MHGIDRRYSRHEFLFHIFFNSNQKALLLFIDGSCKRLHQITGNQRLENMRIHLKEHAEAWPSDKLRVLFALLLNVDMVLKEFICDTSNKALLSDCLCIPLDALQNNEAILMCQSSQASPEKLRGFFKLLRAMVKSFLPDQMWGYWTWMRCVTSEYVAS